MKTIHITIDDALLQKVDQAAHLNQIACSQFIRQVLEDALRQQALKDLEQKQAEGYRNFPVTGDEFDIGETEQFWGGSI